MFYRYPPRGPIIALLQVAVTIWGVVFLTQRFGWPVLAVYLLLVGSCAVIEWKRHLAWKRDAFDWQRRQSPNTAVEPPPATISDQVALSLEALGKLIQRKLLKNWGTWLVIVATLVFFLGAFLRDKFLTKISQSQATTSRTLWIPSLVTRSLRFDSRLPTPDPNFLSTHFRLMPSPQANVASTPISTETPLPNAAVWPDGRTLNHPDHFAETHVVNVTGNDTLKLRSGPGTRFKVVTEIPADSTGISAFDQDQVWDGDTWWCPVAWKGFRGYVSRGYLPK